MKNILISSDKSLIFNRINFLADNSQRLWGKMTVNQMICHCTDQINMAMGKIKVDFVGNFFLKTLAKRLVLLGMPAPKEKVKTYKELDQQIRGTNPTTIENDKIILIDTIKDFDKEFPKNTMVVHPSFGKMNKTQWGRLIYLHLDHHLKQFNS